MATQPWSIVTITVCKHHNSDAAISAVQTGEEQLQFQDIVQTHL